MLSEYNFLSPLKSEGFYFRPNYCLSAYSFKLPGAYMLYKATRAILLCPWERHFAALSPAWWSWQEVLNYSHISIKLQADSNILASPEAGRGNCLPYVLAPLSLSC